ncbi:hypothetical protein T06_15492 [Trichinella sp. T6]|nr:hypothetical protein T06_15492 [Trichinella sp. T6]
MSTTGNRKVLSSRQNWECVNGWTAASRSGKSLGIFSASLSRKISSHSRSTNDMYHSLSNLTQVFQGLRIDHSYRVECRVDFQSIRESY